MKIKVEKKLQKVKQVKALIFTFALLEREPDW